MRFRDLIEHSVKTKHIGFNKTKLRAAANDEVEDFEQNSETPAPHLGVFDASSLQSRPPGDGRTPGATAVALQAPVMPVFEARFLQCLTEVSWMTYVSVIAKQTGTKPRDWEEADGPQIGPGEDFWYAHRTTNQIVQVTVQGESGFQT